MTDPLDEERAEGRLRAVKLARGVSRMLAAYGYASVHEFVLPNGRRVDVAGLGGAGELLFVEIKTSLADYRSDLKWPSYRDFCDRLFFAVPEDFPREVLPQEAGLIVADAYGAVILRETEESRLPAARRKAILLRFAHHAATRLARQIDPEFGAD